MKEIIDGLFLGDVDDAEDADLLNENGIRGIVDCTFDTERVLKKIDDMKYLQLLLRPRDELTSTMIKDVGDFIDSVEGNVLVHCMAGLQRSPSIIISYLTLKGISLDDAISKIEKVTKGKYFPTRIMLQSIMDLEWNVGKPLKMDINEFMESKERLWARRSIDDHMDELW